jgi:hypothetical protein
MATIAGPRTYPRHVGTLVDEAQSRTPLKRSPRRHRGGASQLTLRDSYFEPSVRAAQKLLALRDSSRLALLQNQENSAGSETHMAPFSYRRLSSGPSSPLSFKTSIAANDLAMGQEAASAETQPAVVASPVSLYFFPNL